MRARRTGLDTAHSQRLGPALMPWPQTLEVNGTSVALACADIRVRWVGATSPRLTRGAERFLTAIARYHWAEQPAANASQAGAGQIDLLLDCADATGDYPLPGADESYRLQVQASELHITAATQWGLLSGLLTLAQIWQPSAQLSDMVIEDFPRFPWRGLMLDPARHFLPMATLLHTIDAMALCKLNVLHLHLSDDQGFRFGSEKFPDLASAEHYTQQQLRDLVNYAADRGIRVVPEIDMPGHCTSWLVAYPHWGNRMTQTTDRFGVHGACLNVTDSTVRGAIEQLLTEVALVFPDECLHIGGDEVSPRWWSEDQAIAEFMQAHGIADVVALQAWFNNHVRVCLAKLGKRFVGWDEVLHETFTPSSAPQVTALVQSWRGATARNRVLQAGHDCVVSAGCYLDLMYPADVHYAWDPEASERVLLDQEDALESDPRFRHVAAGMGWTHHWRMSPKDEAEVDTQSRLQGVGVLGGEACLWSELVDAESLNLRLWSRLPVIAERLWSAQSLQDSAWMYERLDAWLAAAQCLVPMNLDAEQQQHLVSADVPAAWLEFVALLEPVKWYARLLGKQALQARIAGSEMPQARPYQVSTPLNRCVDYLYPESFAARAQMQCVYQNDLGAVQSMCAQWRRLGARPNCPNDLVDCRDALLQFATVVEEFCLGTMDSQNTQAALTKLNVPMGEFMLAPVALMLRWLESR